MAFEHMTPLTPETLNQGVAENKVRQRLLWRHRRAETPPAQGTPPAETPPPETKPDEFIENFNKKFSTQYKTDEEIKETFYSTGEGNRV